MYSHFAVPNAFRLVLAGFLTIGLGCLASTAKAQGPNYAMMQAVQSNLDNQRMMSQSQQMSWQNQQTMTTAREQLNSGYNLGNNGIPGVAQLEWEIWTPDSGRIPTVQERAQYFAMLRKMRLAARYGQRFWNP